MWGVQASPAQPLLSLLTNHLPLFAAAGTGNGMISSVGYCDLVPFGVIPFLRGNSVLLHLNLLSSYLLYKYYPNNVKVYFKAEKNNKSALTKELLLFCLFPFSLCLYAHIIFYTSMLPCNFVFFCFLKTSY